MARKEVKGFTGPGRKRLGAQPLTGESDMARWGKASTWRKAPQPKAMRSEPSHRQSRKIKEALESACKVSPSETRKGQSIENA